MFQDLNQFLAFVMMVVSVGIFFARLVWPRLPSQKRKLVTLLAAPSTVICGQSSAGKTALVEHLSNHPLPPNWEASAEIEHRVIIYYQIRVIRK